MRLVIIGNGIAGTSLARMLRKLGSKAEITLISKEKPFFFARTALMYYDMGQIREQDLEPYPRDFWAKNQINCLFDTAQTWNHQNKTLTLASGQTLNYDVLVLALGSQPKTLNNYPLDGSIQGLQGLYHWQDVQRLQKLNIKRAAIIGGGLIGVELAEMLQYRGAETTLILREPAYWANVLPLEEAQMISQHLEKQGIKLWHQDSLAQIQFQDQTKTRIKSLQTQQGQNLNCDFIGICIGVSPNLSFIHNNPQQPALDYDQGILVDDYLQTNLTDVYAIGDCAQIRQPQAHRQAIEAVWYTAQIMGQTLAHTLHQGQKQAYQPKIWFNSAKFFELEYQVYGQVPKQKLDKDNNLFWQNPKQNQALRLVFDPQTQSLIGIHGLGLRLRQEVCQAWIQTQTPIKQVLQELEKANFNPEFSAPYQDQVRAAYQAQFGETIHQTQASKSKWTNLLSFFRPKIK